MQMQVQREHVLFLAPLLVLAAASWALLIWQAGMMNGMGLTMGMGIGVFLAVWVVMMVAMMVPATAPMNLAFARVQRERGSFGRALVPPWIFVGAYLLIWTLFGVLAYLGTNAASELIQQIPWLQMNATRISGGILVLAGLHQFTPFKRVCLTKCCMRQQFIRDGWRDGLAGAFRLGISHGLYCLGANWLLFVLLFPVGLMNIVAMVVLTLLICAEKCFPQPERITWGVGLALILYGTLVLVMPAALLLNGAGMSWDIPRKELIVHREQKALHGPVRRKLFNHFKGVHFMLTIGKLLTDEQGRVAVRRVLSLESGAAKVETTFEAIGLFHDIHSANLGTGWSIIRPDGTLYGEWQGGLRTVDNDTAV